jgi:Flp pilus assembly protein TadD
MVVAIRAALVHVVVLGLGAWAVWAQFFYRAPQRFPIVLLAVLSMAATAMMVFLGLVELYHALGGRPRHPRAVAVGHRLGTLTILGFTVWGVFLFANGTLDRSEPVAQATEIVEIGIGESELGLVLPFTWATVRSWQGAPHPVRMLLRRDERRRLWAAQPVVVLIHRGFFGVPWVAAIEPDFDRQSRELLTLLPDAVEIWKRLALFNLRIGRFDEARQATSEYVARFPDDPEFPVHVAGVLTTRERFADVVTLLTPVAAAHPHPGAYMYLGYALGMQGRRAEGLAYLERARDMTPDSWWPHYALGWVYAALGDTPNAVRSFERTLQLRPGLADVEQQLQRLRPRVAGQRG